MGSIEVIAVGGESEVVAGARLLIGGQRIHCFGVLDADQKNQLGGAKNLRALPGHQVPESEPLTVALSKTSDVALALGRSPEAYKLLCTIADLWIINISSKSFRKIWDLAKST